MRFQNTCLCSCFCVNTAGVCVHCGKIKGCIANRNKLDFTPAASSLEEADAGVAARKSEESSSGGRK